MVSVTAEQIKRLLGERALQVYGDQSRRVVTARPLGEDTVDSITYCAAKGDEALRKIRKCEAGIVVCPFDLTFRPEDFSTRTLIQVKDPRLEFVRILNAFFVTTLGPGVHATSVIHSKAKVDSSVHVGPFCYIDQCEIGEGTIIYGHVRIYDHVRIGRRVVIHAGCVVGADGFGFARSEQGELEKFPQVGGVIVEDDVELQAGVHVARGALGDTRIGKGTKIDSGCHIAHNDVIGKHCAIAAHTMFAGSVKLGDYCYVGPLTAFRDHIEVGDRVTIGLASVVTKDIPSGASVMGAPARAVEEYKKMLSAVRSIAGID